MNNLLIGSSIKSIQVISPVLSAILMSKRAINVAKPRIEEGFAYFVVYLNMALYFIVLFGTFGFALVAYDASDRRPEWAKVNFDIV